MISNLDIDREKSTDTGLSTFFCEKIEFQSIPGKLIKKIVSVLFYSKTNSEKTTKVDLPTTSKGFYSEDEETSETKEEVKNPKISE